MALMFFDIMACFLFFGCLFQRISIELNQFFCLFLPFTDCRFLSHEFGFCSCFGFIPFYPVFLIILFHSELFSQFF